jgi:hypothetical protein
MAGYSETNLAVELGAPIRVFHPINAEVARTLGKCIAAFRDDLKAI